MPDLSSKGPYATGEDKATAHSLKISVRKLRQQRAEEDLTAAKPNVYALAAQALEERRPYGCHARVGYACHALDLVGAPHERCNEMKDWFAPDGCGAWLFSAELSQRQSHNFRILALCFMAALEDAGELLPGNN
jgi:hypothetical protein